MGQSSLEFAQSLMERAGNKLGVVLGAAVSILVAVALRLTVVYSGAYHVAASDDHTDVVKWTFDTTTHRSVVRRADGTRLLVRSAADVLARGEALGKQALYPLISR